MGHCKYFLMFLTILLNYQVVPVKSTPFSNNTIPLSNHHLGQKGNYCVSPCEKAGESYEWCYVNDRSWQYCSSVPGFDCKGNKCKNSCASHQGTGYTWCNLEKGGWDYCGRVVISSETEYTYLGSKCVSPCEFTPGNGYNFCYDDSRKKKFCSMLPGLAANNRKCTSACDTSAWNTTGQQKSIYWCHTSSSKDGGSVCSNSSLMGHPVKGDDEEFFLKKLIELSRTRTWKLENIYRVVDEPSINRVTFFENVPRTGNNTFLSWHDLPVLWDYAIECIKGILTSEYQPSSADTGIEFQAGESGNLERNGIRLERRKRYTDPITKLTYVNLHLKVNGISSSANQERSTSIAEVDTPQQYLVDNPNHVARALLRSLKEKCAVYIGTPYYTRSGSSYVVSSSTDDSVYSQSNIPVEIEHLDMSSFELYNPEVASIPPTEIPLIAYIRSQPTQGFDARTVLFPKNAKVAIYIHGYATADLLDGLDIRDALFDGTGDVDVVLLVDWRKLSLPESDHWWTFYQHYNVVALQNVPIVAEQVKRFLVRRLQNENFIHLLGFSLGGQIAGTAARIAASHNLTVDRISALDPAGPIFEYSMYDVYPVVTTNTLRPTDAIFIDVIHASTVLGMNKVAGHLDIYLSENECWLPSCRHHKAVELYISSLNLCSLITCPKDGGPCSPNTISSLGYLSDKYAGRGEHEVTVNTHWYGWGDKKCSEFMNAYMPAKHRVCHEAPNDNSLDCKEMPYLRECRVPCEDDERFMSYQNIVCSHDHNVRLRNARLLQGKSILVSSPTETVAYWQLSGHCGAAAVCRNEDGKHIDFFIAYKSKSGSEYFVVYPGSGMVKGRETAESPGSVFGRTLQSVFIPSKEDPVNFIWWNNQIDWDCLDEMDAGQTNMVFPGEYSNSSADDEILSLDHSSSNGHSKGVLAFTEHGGYLMIHSIPKFPRLLHKSYRFPSNGMPNAQMAVCVTIKNGDDASYWDKLNQILKGIHAFAPEVGKTRLSNELESKVGHNFKKLLGKKRRRPGESPEKTNVYVDSGFKLHLFSGFEKPQDPNDMSKDAFKSLAEEYGTPLLAQTWKDRKSGDKGNWNSSCVGLLTVENIQKVKVLGQNGESQEWNRSQDHSKWAVAKLTNGVQPKPLFCAGDLNRAPATMARGGMFLCTEDRSVYNAFARVPIEAELCE